MPRRVVLASTSMYRRDLLRRLGLSFVVDSPDFEELATGDPEDRVRGNARGKAESVAVREPDAVIIGSDQLVVVDTDVLGKPGTREAAERQLARLAGREHRLLTALTVIDTAASARHEHLDVTTLRLRPLTPAEITDYVTREQPLDCAGSYKIEGLGISLFASVRGEDPTAIIGLPLMAVVRCLERVGVRTLGD